MGFDPAAGAQRAHQHRGLEHPEHAHPDVELGHVQVVGEEVPHALTGHHRGHPGDHERQRISRPTRRQDLAQHPGGQRDRDQRGQLLVSLGEGSAGMNYVTELLPIAKDAARIASRMAKERPISQIASKGDRDMVSNVDIDIEATIRSYLKEKTPHIDFLGEESGGSIEREFAWVLDPIDGTANFVRGVPLCGVSLAVMHHGKVVVGVIDLPFLGGVQYHAVEGAGAFRDGERIGISNTASLAEAIVAVGDYATGADAKSKNRARLAITGSLAANVQRVRMFGTAAIDLAWVAEGKIDACVTLTNNSWDMAAGVIIAKEAGAAVIDIEGEEHTAKSSSTIAVTPRLKSDLLGILSG